MENYKVLWIDDQPSESFLDIAYENDIEIVVRKCFSDGINWLENNKLICDAVILDANCKINNDESEAPSLESLRDSLNQVWKICIYDKFIPWFVYTGGGYQGEDSLRYIIPNNRDWDDRQFYKKPQDRKELFANLKKSADNSLVTQIKLKYNKVFSPEIEKDLISVLSCVEKKSFDDNNVFNPIRKILDWVMEFCNRAGILLIPFNGSNLGECSGFLGRKELSSIIPIYIQRSFHSCSQVSNEGSHRLVIDDHVKNGRAPFLIQSTVCELLNILYWCKSLSLNREEVDFLKDKITALTSDPEIGNEDNCIRQEGSIPIVVKKRHEK